MKTCTKCFVEKPETEYYKSKYGLHGSCKACYCLSCNKNRQKKIKEIHRYDQERSWQRRGILNEDGSPFKILDFDRWYQVQQGRCKICKKHSTEFKRNLAADHNHETGIIRGLLCLNCNRGLGSFQEEKNLLKEAIKYLGL